MYIANVSEIKKQCPVCRETLIESDIADYECLVCNRQYVYLEKLIEIPAREVNKDESSD